MSSKNEAGQTLNSSAPQSGHEKSTLRALTIAALGVVFGDIGTSPLYALRECFVHHPGIPRTPESVMGILSLIVWSLIVVISIKYMLYIMRADNKGEGGIFALLALLRDKNLGSVRGKGILMMIGVFGASLLYGDGIITPAISILSSVEGLKVATDFFNPYVLPLAIAILCVLFFFQSKGTGAIGAVFGPCILVWFSVLGILGLRGILQEPAVLASVNPLYAIEFFAQNGLIGFMVLSSVFLVVTGGEALYADMGHFGRKPIVIGWFLVVFPGLLLNYFGQGAILIQDFENNIRNPFYLLAPSWALYPMVVLATIATFIASQALISGVFSITRQGILLGYLPRQKIIHTSSKEIGQIYIPQVNWILLVLTIIVVLEFGSASALAAAYGIAVSTDMVISTILTFFVTYKIWKWKLPFALLVALGFVLIDLAFFGTNLTKFFHGGWLPIVIALAVAISMQTWRRGRHILFQKLRGLTFPLEKWNEVIATIPYIHRVEGTAIYMTSDQKWIPPALVHNLKHNHSLHERVVFLTIETTTEPNVRMEDTITISKIAKDVFQVKARYGFKETPRMSQILELCRAQNLNMDVDDTSFFLGSENLVPCKKPVMAGWRRLLFSFMARNSQKATGFFDIPSARVFEIGLQLEL